jgi:uncharacterized protein YggE
MQRSYLPIVVAGVILAGFALVLAGAGPGTVGADDGPTTNHSITVSATGDASAAPDEAILRVAVTADGSDPAAIRDELAANASDLRSALDELGVDYEMTDYSIGEQRRPEERGNRPAYRGVHAFEIVLDDTDRTGQVVDAAAGVGAEIDAVRLTLSEDTRDQLRDEAIGAAMADSRHQAETIAAAGNLSITSVATVDANEERFRPIAFESAAADGGGGTTIESGDVSVTYRVQVTYIAASA